jgi:hypothetical protein
MVRMPDIFEGIGGWFDPYSRTARLAPGLLLLLGPVAVVVCAGASQLPITGLLVATAVSAGLPLALAEWVRRRGQQLQRDLWDVWGGEPAVSRLESNSLMARRRRAALAHATALPALLDPSHPEFRETAAYAVRQLIAATRDVDRYNLIFAENKLYGFSRNLLGIRSYGVRISSVACLAALIVVSLGIFLPSTFSVAESVVGLASAVVMLAFWYLYPSEDRVKAACEDYCDRLFEALEAGAMRDYSGPEALPQVEHGQVPR